MRLKSCAATDRAATVCRAPGENPQRPANDFGIVPSTVRELAEKGHYVVETDAGGVLSRISKATIAPETNDSAAMISIAHAKPR